jgi:hypothetical protein
MATTIFEVGLQPCAEAEGPLDLVQQEDNVNSRHLWTDSPRVCSVRGVTNMAMERAHRSHDVIDRSNALHLSAREAEGFLTALTNPPEPSAELKKAAKRYRKAITEGELETA